VDTLGAAVAASRAQTSFPQSVQWESGSIAQGNAGVALLCAAMDRAFPGEGWDCHGHAHLEAAVRAAHARPSGASLFAGLAGVGFAAVELAAGRPRYRRLLTGIDDVVAAEATASAKRLTSGGSLPVGEFDAVSGLSGLAAYLLRRGDSSHVAAAALSAVLTALAGRLTYDSQPPGWHTAERWLSEEERRHYPHGNLNCGLAHGLPGPLAALALASLHGVDVPAGVDAIASAAAWLTGHRIDDEWGPNWPDAVPLAADGSEQAPPWPSRAGWCYGAPGVARALWLAGQALEEAPLRNLAVAAIEAVVARPAERRGLSSPTFCHGAAGLLQVLVRFAADTGAADLATAAGRLCGELVDAFDPTSLLGYRNVEPGEVVVDHPGLVDGAPGVALALLAAGTDVEPTWDRLFLLS
jgi:lantibiotic biosynthesis protein